MNGVADGEVKNGEGLATLLDTPHPTMKESHVCKDSHRYGASGETGVAKNPPLMEQYNSWFTACEDVSDAEIPPEFL